MAKDLRIFCPIIHYVSYRRVGVRDTIQPRLSFSQEQMFISILLRQRVARRGEARQKSLVYLEELVVLR